MHTSVRAAGFAAAILVLGGCASYEMPTPYWTIRESAFRELVPGQSTRADARKLIGVPESTMRFAAKGEEIWEYRYLLTTYGMLAHLHFDLQGTYKYAYHMPDAVLNGEGIDN